MTIRRETRARRDARNERKRSQTRDEILDAASEVVLRDGFASFTLAAVARELDLTNPALYYYFRSREALLFELILREWIACGQQVQAAVEATETGADAIEALIRAVFARYSRRLDMFMLTSGKAVDIQASALDAGALERIRPVNDMLYGGAERRLRAEQRAGRFPRRRNPRRFVFTAHTSVMGLLTMQAITESADDPLIHSGEDLIDDLCETFRSAACAGVSR
jgi:TetR/AcrR family transcriptional regulator